MWYSTKTTFNVYVSQRSQIQFEDEDHAVHMSFRWVTTTLSSLRTTTCDALIVPSDDIIIISYSLQAVNSVVTPDRGDAGMSPRADERSQTEEEHNDDEHPPG